VEEKKENEKISNRGCWVASVEKIRGQYGKWDSGITIFSQRDLQHSGIKF
jgi:hypothetical protein